MNQPVKRSWWGRNWKWVVPVLCLTPLLVCGGIFTIALRMMKSSEVYTEAVAKARASASVKALLGEPITEGFWVNGGIEVSGTTGKADFAIPLSGPKGSATLYVVATKRAGRWEFSTLEVAASDSGSRVYLRPRPDEEGPGGR
jgi:hypothetical protein